MYIHQHQQWPHFVWNKEAVAIKLAEVNKAAGYLEGRLSAIGFDAQMKAVVETVSHSVICSSEIEGVQLNSDQVRSSVARKLGVPISGEVASSHYVDGVVEMMLDAMVHFYHCFHRFWPSCSKEAKFYLTNSLRLAKLSI